MRISQAFPSDYIKSSDLNGREVRVVIEKVKIEEVGREKEERPVIYFEGKEKGMVLNKTNANAIATAFGDDTDDWTGGEVILYAAMTEFQGKSVEGLRVKIAPSRAASRAASRRPDPEVTTGVSERRRPAAQVDPDDLNDDIPF